MMRRVSDMIRAIDLNHSSHSAREVRMGDQFDGAVIRLM